MLIKIFIPLLSIMAGIVFLWGAYSLLGLRFTRGDIHEQYSTFRSDPLGCKVLYESLEKIPGLSVCRLLGPVDEIENPAKSVLLIAGAHSDTEIIQGKKLLDFVLQGGRLVVLFSRDALSANSPAPKNKPEKEGPPKGKNIKESKDEKLHEASIFHKLNERWGFCLYRLKPSAQHDKTAAPSKPAEEELGFALIPFYSRLYFETSGGWNTTHYFCNGNSVIMERTLGAGSVMLSADCHFISNEALSRQPASKLICHALSDRKNIYFDETVHGMGKEKNIVWLGQKYKLGLLLANISFLALLFVWKSSFSIAAAGAAVGRERPADKNRNNGAGPSSPSGLSNLMGRGIPKKDLMEVCVREWEKTAGFRKISGEETDKIKETARETRDNVETYNKIHEIIHRTKARKK